MTPWGGGLHLRGGVLFVASGRLRAEFGEPEPALEWLRDYRAKYCGRKHAQWYCSDLETIWRWLFVCEGEPLERLGRRADPMWSASYMVCAHWGHTHLRDVRSWVSDVSDLQGAEEIDVWRRSVALELHELGGSMRGTGSGSGHSLWRGAYNPARKWQVTPDDTEHHDWCRRAYYGARTSCHQVGIIARRGHVPGRLARQSGAPVRIVPDGMRLWRIDQRSAFPAAMAGRLPWVWSQVEPRWNRELPNGIVEGVVRVGAPDCLPLRVRSAKRGWRQCWGLPGQRVRGVWTATTLREAERLGCVVEEVTRAVSYRVDYRPLADLCGAVFTRARGLNGPVRDAVKSLSRRLYGRFATSRWRYRWMHIRDYLAEGHKIIPRYQVGRWVYVQDPEPTYPATSQPTWAAEITSRVNITLRRVETALRSAGLPVYYSDTDSVLFAAPQGETTPFEVPEDVERRVGPGLGQWRVEWSGDWAILLGPKWYGLSGGRTALAGIPKALQTEVIRACRA